MAPCLCPDIGTNKKSRPMGGLFYWCRWPDIGMVPSTGGVAASRGSWRPGHRRDSRTGSFPATEAVTKDQSACSRSARFLCGRRIGFESGHRHSAFAGLWAAPVSRVRLGFGPGALGRGHRGICLQLGIPGVRIFVRKSSPGGFSGVGILLQLRPFRGRRNPPTSPCSKTTCRYSFFSALRPV